MVLKCEHWLQFVLGLFACLCGGSLYGWSIISEGIRTRMAWTASEINLVYAFGIWGCEIGLFGGYLFDKRGPRLTSLYGAVLGGVGYLMMYTQYKTQFSMSPLLMGVFLMMVGQGSLGCYMTGLLTNSRNFPAKFRGAVVGSLSAAFGLSASVLSAVYKAYFKEGGGVQNYLMMLSTTLFSVGLICPLLMRLIPNDTPLLQQSLLAEESGDTSINEVPKKEEGKVWRVLCKTEYWVSFVFFGCVCGAGVMFIGQIALLAKSQGISSEDKLLMVSFTSYANCLGRFVTCVVSDATQAKLSRNFYMMCVSVVMGVAHFVLASSLQKTFLLPATWVVGFAYGAGFGITPTYLSERYGTTNMGFVWGSTIISLGLGNAILSAVAGAVRDSHSTHDTQGELECVGLGCSSHAFYVSGSLCIVGFLLSLVLMKWNRKTGQWM